MTVSYTIRARQRTSASPGGGRKQSWSEWQVVQGRKVLGRFDLEGQAGAFRDSLVMLDRCAVVGGSIPAATRHPRLWEAFWDGYRATGAGSGPKGSGQSALEQHAWAVGRQRAAAEPGL